MKLRTQLSVLHPDTVVCLLDYDKLELVIKVKNIPKELKERQVDKLFPTRSDNAFDLYIELKV